MKIPGKDFLLAIISAVLLIVSFPRHNYSLLAWVGLIPLLIALKGKTLRRAFGFGFTMGICFLMGVYYWINVLEKFELADFLLLGIYLGTYFGFFALILNFVSEKTHCPPFLSAPCLWVSTEYLRSIGGFLALPWPFLGYSQFLNLPIIQISNITGVYGVSFLIVMVNASLAEIVLRYLNNPEAAAIRSKTLAWLPVIFSATFVGVSFWYGVHSMRLLSENGNVRVAVIQANIPQELRWNPQLWEKNLQRHIQLTRESARDGNVSLIVWPETTVQGSLAQNKALLKMLADVSKEAGAYLLVGSAERPKFGLHERGASDIYNSAFLISPDGHIAGRYDKIHLLPFGEYLPVKHFPWPSRIASAWVAGEFSPGTKYTVFTLDNIKFAVSICWENIFADHVRNFVKKGAGFMINITNEAWFGKTAAPYQFMAMSVFRAVENRISIARAANTGVSGFIDPFGKIMGTVGKHNRDIFVEGYLQAALPISTDRTFYTRYGDFFALTCMAISIMLVCLGVRQ